VQQARVVGTFFCMDAGAQRSIHLFDGSRLLGAGATTGDEPDDEYDIDGTRYVVESYLAITESDGTRGFDVQVRPA
jgi:hypothetical protein